MGTVPFPALMARTQTRDLWRLAEVWEKLTELNSNFEPRIQPR